MSETQDIKLEDIKRPRPEGNAEGYCRDNPSDSQPVQVEDVEDATISSWAWTAAASLGALSACLVLFPRAMLMFSDESTPRTMLTPLERYLALQLGILLAAAAATLITTIPSTNPVAPWSQRSRADLAYHPLLVPVTSASLLMGFTSYNTSSAGGLPSLVALGSSVVGLYGLWAIMFAGSASVSKKTGADKHTSAFIFGNKSAASVKKKYWRQQRT